MAQSIHLYGSEHVRAAGSDIKAAAERIEIAAAAFDASIKSHEKFLNDWLDRLIERLRVGEDA